MMIIVMINNDSDDNDKNTNKMCRTLYAIDTWPASCSVIV